MQPTKRGPGGDPRQPEVPVIDDPAEPVEPKVLQMTPPVPDPPVGLGYGSDEHYYHAEGWEPGSWHPLPASPAGRGIEHY